MANLSEMNALLEEVLRPILVDHIEHPWRYDFRALILLQDKRMRLVHDESCAMCNIGRRIQAGESTHKENAQGELK